MPSHQKTVSEPVMGVLSFFTLFVIGTDTFLIKSDRSHVVL